MVLVTTETLISGNHRDAVEALYAADGGIERAIGDLRTLADWQSVPGAAAGNATPDFRDGASAPRLSDGTILDLSAADARAAGRQQCRLSGRARTVRSGASSPTRRSTGCCPPGVIRSPAYVVLWIADDVDDGDGDPLRDSNGALLVRAEAFGLRGVRRRIDATLARERGGRWVRSRKTTRASSEQRCE